LIIKGTNKAMAMMMAPVKNMRHTMKLNSPLAMQAAKVA
jgi:hypothetical protein